MYGSVKVRRVYKLVNFESQYEKDRPGVETTIGTFDQLKFWSRVSECRDHGKSLGSLVILVTSCDRPVIPCS